jgi:hypothetical protein
LIESHIDQKHVKIYKANWELATKTDKENTTIGYHPELYTRNIIVSAAASKNWHGHNGQSCDSSTAI